MQEPRRMAVVRALAGLGDMLCAVPALRALRGAFPQTELVLIGVPQGIRVLERFPQYVDSAVELPGWNGLPEAPPRPEALPAFHAAVGQGFDLAIQMHGAGDVSNEITAALGAPVTAGYYPPNRQHPDRGRYLPWSGRQHEVRRWLSLIAHLDIPLRGEYLEYPVSEADRDQFATLAAAHDLRPFSYACVHPGAGHPTRQWPPERFATVADALARRGYRVVLTGSESERPITKAVREGMNSALQSEVLDLAGQTDMGTLGVLLEQSRLLVCNDTGVSHIAAALRVPSVVVFSASDPVRWAPANRRLHRVIIDGSNGSGICRSQAQSANTAVAEAEALLQQHRPSISRSEHRIPASSNGHRLPDARGYFYE